MNRVVEKKSISSYASLIILIVVNLLPVFGVVRWGWDVFEIVSLYWFENVVIGAINILKMLVACGELSDVDDNDPQFRHEHVALPDYLRNSTTGSGILRHGAKLFFIPFFTIHYGMFCFVHGIFVFFLLGGEKGGGIAMSAGPFDAINRLITLNFHNNGIWFVLGIVGSHLFSYLYYFIGKGEFRHISAPALMKAPYGRIVVLHVAIIFGAFVITALGSRVYLLLILIIGKILLDAKLHCKSRQKSLATVRATRRSA